MSNNSNTSKIIFSILLLGLIGLLAFAGKYFFSKKEITKQVTPPKIEHEEEVKISTGTFVDERDAQMYNWIQYGSSKKWMAQNLNFNASNSWCYNDNPNCKVKGRLYSWNAAMRACPKGWHLPQLEEWNNLLDRFENTDESFVNLTQEDKDNFGVQFGGVRDGNKNFNFLNENGNFWTATKSKSSQKWYINFSKSLSKVFTLSENRNLAFSCRCVEGSVEESKNVAQTSNQTKKEDLASSRRAKRQNETLNSSLAKNESRRVISGNVSLEVFDQKSQSYQSMKISEVNFSGDQIVNKPKLRNLNSMVHFISDRTYPSYLEYRLQVSGEAEAYVFTIDNESKVFGLYPLAKGGKNQSTNNSTTFSGDMILGKPGSSEYTSSEVSAQKTTNRLTITEKVNNESTANETKIVLLSRIPLDINNILYKIQQTGGSQNPEEKLMYILKSKGFKWANSNVSASENQVDYTLGNENISILPMVFVIKRN